MSKRQCNLQIRLFPHEMAAFMGAATPMGLTVSDWARSRLLHAARAEAAQLERDKAAAIQDLGDAEVAALRA